MLTERIHLQDSLREIHLIESALSSDDITALIERLSRLDSEFRSLGVDPCRTEIDFPETLLVKELSSEQKKVLEQLLGTISAHRSVAHQNLIKTIEIIESNERMIDLRTLFSDQNIDVVFSDKGYSEACGEWAGKPRLFWMRETAARRVLIMAKILNTMGYIMRIEDCYRPVGVQEGLFSRRIKWILDETPEIDPNELLIQAMSKTAVTPRLASHKAGAAIDFTILSNNYTPLNIGNVYPEGGAVVAIDYPFLTREQWVNRQFFKALVLMNGGSVYMGEDWHASFGDNLCGIDCTGNIKEGYVAMYGPLSDFDLSSGVVTPANVDSYDQPLWNPKLLT